MFLRYWMVNGKATVIENVDRIVFDSLVMLQFRCNKGGCYEWDKITYGIDYLQFTMSED